MYKREWEKMPQFKDWLTADANNPNKAVCIICHQYINYPSLFNLCAHAASVGHTKIALKLATLCNTNEPIRLIQPSTTTSKTSKLEQLLLSGSKRKNICLSDFFTLKTQTDCDENGKTIHLTECVKVLKELAKIIKEDLIADVGDQPYSILIEQYTKSNWYNYLCFCIRYFSVKQQCIVNRFLGLAFDVKGAIRPPDLGQYLCNIKLKPQNLIGLAIEAEAHNLYIGNKSLYQNLKQRYCPKLQLVRFLPHSLALCFSNAADNSLTQDVLFLWVNIYNYFCQTRSCDYEIFFGRVDMNNWKRIFQVDGNPWLYGFDVIDIIVENWDELRTYYMEVSSNYYLTVNYFLSEIFVDKLNDDKIYLYYIIIHSILSRINDVHLKLHKENIDIIKIYPELYQLLLNLMKMIIEPTVIIGLEEMSKVNFDTIVGILEESDPPFIQSHLLDYGQKFNQAKFKSKLSDDIKIEIQRSCQNVIFNICKNITQRFPENIEVFQSLRTLSPLVALEQRNRPEFTELPLSLIDENESLLKFQWQHLQDVNLSNMLFTSVEQFWIYIRDHVGENGEFPDIANFVLLKALSLPATNSVIANSFSLIGFLVAKAEHIASGLTIEAIIQIKHIFFCKEVGLECFELTNEIIEKLDSIECDELCIDDEAFNLIYLAFN